MSSFEALFSGANFRGTVQKYCKEIGWKISDIDDKHAVLEFGMDSGRDQTLYIIRYETTLEFSVPSMAIFDSEDDIPHRLSTLLLQRSSERKIGFWCIEKAGGKFVYSCMHNAELQLIDTEYFAKVVQALIRECDEFEGLLIKLFKNR